MCCKLINLPIVHCFDAVAGLIYKITCVMVKGPHKNYQTKKNDTQF